MKRLIVLFTALLALITAFSGCVETGTENDTNYEVLIVSEGKNPEYKFADESRYNAEPPEKTKEFIYNGEQKELIYEETVYNSYNYFPEYKYYIDKESGYVYFDPENNITKIKYSKDKNNENELPLNELVEIAKKFLLEHVSVPDLSEYTIETRAAPPFNYEIFFVKYISGIKATDNAFMRVDMYGNVSDYTTTMFGKVPADTENPFELEKAKSAVYERLDNYYADKKDDYDEISYGKPDFRLTVLKDGKTALACSVAVRLRKDIEGEKDPQYISELMRFVVTTE
ncbi:MAG: hypothetical protein IJO64_04435 [Clostridia bacterium]|nr:hypothetical protein [Clostridia bacterium]